MIDGYLLIGFVAAFLVLAAYVQASRGRWKATSFKFQIYNAIGAGLLILYGLHIHGYPNVALNAIWLGVACFALVKQSRRSKRKGS